MSDNEGVLFIPYSDTVDLLSAKEASLALSKSTVSE